MRKPSLPSIIGTAALACALSACSPTFNWRDYHSADAAYTALFPDKPASYTRAVDLDGIQVNMTMTAAQVDGGTFAVGSALLGDAGKARAALTAMKIALTKNIDATINKESASATPGQSAIAIEASGMHKGKQMLLIGRFIARDKRIYQIIVLAPDQRLSRETTEMFMASFKPD